MWSKLFGGRDELPRAKVDAVVRVVDRYLSEEAKFRGLQSKRQAIRPRDLPPQKRRAFVEEVLAIIGERGRSSLLESLQWYTTGLSDPRSSLHQEADRDFANARRKALLRRVVAFLRRNPRSDELLSFERVRRELGAAGQAYLGMQSVPVWKIVGSVGRHGDFDGAFLPSKGHLRERWQRINRMLRQRGVLPSVSLYKVGDAYFVSYGHHRVSVTRYHGIEWIDARVTELYGPSAPETRPPALRRHRDARRDRGRSRERNGPARKFRAPRSTESPANYRRSSGGAPGAYD